MKQILYKILTLIVLLILLAFFVEMRKIINPIPPKDKEIIDIEDKIQILEQDRLEAILPKVIVPGDPIMLTNLASSTAVKMLFDGKDIPIVSYKGKQKAFIPIDFNEKTLKHEARIILSNGMTIVEPITVTSREKIEKPLGIPEKLGGNTPQAEKALVSNLALENEILTTVKTGPAQLWSQAFGLPLKSIFVTDDYGYDRKTGNSTIIHKGTDFRATEGTEVGALNDGIVRIARTFTVYGNTIVIDHGLGLQSLYMHLSEIRVKEGDTVKRGQIIALSGKTGYAEAPHLHISIKIRGISIDPMTFLRFFNVI